MWYLYCGLIIPSHSSSTTSAGAWTGKKCGKIFCETQLQLQWVVYRFDILRFYHTGPRAKYNHGFLDPLKCVATLIERLATSDHESRQLPLSLPIHTSGNWSMPLVMVWHPSRMATFVLALVFVQQSLSGSTWSTWWRKLDHWNSFTLPNSCQNLGSNIFTEKYLNKIREIESRPSRWSLEALEIWGDFQNQTMRIRSQGLTQWT